MDMYQPCFLCPRRCGVSRESSAAILPDGSKNTGYCGESADLRLACANIHQGEEPPLTGTGDNGPGKGSGTIFVSGCNLGCVFCQNWQISLGGRHRLGRIADTAEFTRICLALQEKGAENINIVTGSHAVPALVKGIAAAKTAGLTVPVLWNSSAYELPETLELLVNTVDVFLPDMKTLDSRISGNWYNAPDYPAVASSAIEKMLKMKPVMIRHLVLPGCLESSRAVLQWFADRCAGRALLSLMFQYTQALDQGGVSQGPRRYITRREYDTVLGWLNEFEINDGYCQELVPGNTSWLPDFEKNNPFPSDLSVPVWHWKKGFTSLYS